MACLPVIVKVWDWLLVQWRIKLTYNSEFFRGISQRHPVFAPQTTAVYSNSGFRILGYVLEAMSRTSYNTLVQSKVLGPLGLTDTSAALPPRRGSWAIPVGNLSGFHYNYSDEIP